MGCGKSKPSKHGSEGDGKPTWKPNACFIGNLVGWLVFGVLLSGWLLRYTDHFKFFGGLLALGGLFSWLAFVFKVIPDDRLGVLQEEFCKVVFDEPRALAVPAAGTLIVGLLFFSLGTVEVGNTQSTVAAVYFTKTAERPADEESPLTAVSVPPGKHVRFVRWAPVFSHTSYTVKSPGFQGKP